MSYGLAARNPLVAVQTQGGLARMDIVVLGLMAGLLVAVIVPSLFGHVDGPEMRQAGARSDMKAIASALAAYKQDNATYPSTRQGLEALVHRPSGEPAAANWKGYLREFPKDPWGNLYHYTSPSASYLYVLASDGSDGKSGGDDLAADIVVRYPARAD